MNIILFGTSPFGIPILKALLAAGHVVPAIVTTPDGPTGRKQTLTESAIAQTARELGIPIHKPAVLKNNQELLTALRQLHSDIFIVVAYGKILPPELIDLPPHKTLNVHASLLPKYRGAAPIQYALLNGETTTGTTIMLMEPELDSGPIIAQCAVTIAAPDRFPELAEKLSQVSAELLVESLPKYISKALIPQPQDASQATYTKIISKADGRIDWQKPAAQIYNQYRAFFLWPGIWTTWQNEPLKILDCAPSTKQASESGISSAAPGTMTPGGIVCGDGSILEMRQLQKAGKKPASWQDFLNGHPAAIGQPFE